MVDFLDDNLLAILEMVTKVMIAIISVIGAFATSKLPDKWRKEADEARLTAEEKLRDAMHMAAITGVTRGVQEGLSGVDLVSFAVKHMIRSVPDSLVGLTPIGRDLLKKPVDEALAKMPTRVREVLENIAKSKIPEVFSQIKIASDARGIEPPRPVG